MITCREIYRRNGTQYEIGEVMDVMQVIKDQIEKNPVILYMKGSPQFPQCGFSAQVVEAMTAVGKPFAYVNILEAPEIRQTLKEYPNSPTYPQ